MPDSISIRVETNQPATMRDGTTLYADVYRPDGPGPFPTILQRHRVGLFALRSHRSSPVLVVICPVDAADPDE